MRRITLASRLGALVAVFVLALSTAPHLSSAVDFDGCGGPDDPTCLRDLAVDNIRIPSPRFSVQIDENIFNESLELDVVVESTDPTQHQRCLPFGSPAIRGTVGPNVTEISIPSDVVANITFFLNCNYTVTITSADGARKIWHHFTDVPEELTGRELLPIRQLTLAATEGAGFRLEWRDADPVWAVHHFEVAYFRPSSILPDGVASVTPTRRLLLNASVHSIFINADTRYSYTFRVYSVGAAPLSFGKVTVGTHSYFGDAPVIESLPSPFRDIEVSDHVPTTRGGLMTVSLRWHYDPSFPGLEDGVPVRLAMTVDEGTDEDETTRCAGLPGFRILQLSSDRTSLTLPLDFPGEWQASVHYGCHYRFQLAAVINGTQRSSEIASFSTHARLDASDVADFNSTAYYEFDANVKLLETQNSTASLQVNMTWILPVSPLLLPPFFLVFQGEAYQCNQRRRFGVQVPVTVGLNDTSGHRYYASLNLDDVPVPYCVICLVSAIVLRDPLDESSSQPTRFSYVKLNASAVTVAPTTSERLTSAATSAMDSTVTPQVGTTSSRAAGSPGGGSGGVSLTILIPVVTVSALCILLYIVVAVVRYHRNAAAVDRALSKYDSKTGIILDNKMLEEYDLEKPVWKVCQKHMQVDLPEFDIGEFDDGRKVDKLSEFGVNTQVQILMHNLSLHGFDVEITSYLGAGQFGQVFKAELEDADGVVTDVAIKSLHPKATVVELKQFHDEIDIMKDLEPHENVIRMLGCCEEGLASSCLIVEYMEHGNLQDFLRESRKNRDASVGSADSPYHNETGSTAAELLTVEITDSGCLGVKDTLHFAMKIAAGMVHLEKLEIVHRDLAARNVLLGKGNMVKICDFGLAQDVYHVDITRETEKKGMPLPYRWMALESLQSKVFTTASDVWSYGIVLWEIATAGVHPYPTTDNGDLLDLLLAGKRLAKPEDCSDGMYAVMLECWDELPENRPAFTEISQTLDGMRTKFLQYVEVDI
eukprot:scpid23116/ scgid4128/ Hepatocyte growth factor receptor; HGF/SF receptor; Proto-oncogene c-Met; Scatter factor receptor; Tyrosine-protein kinase Met